MLRQEKEGDFIAYARVKVLVDGLVEEGEDHISGRWKKIEKLK